MGLDIRIGHGYDVHRLVRDRELYIGGVKIPYTFGLLGHSDADVLLHALMDAMLGAAAMPDIGKLFPDRDARYAGIRSTELLLRVSERIRDGGYRLMNADMTVVAQMPKMSPYIDEMRKTVADILGVNISRIGIKATTEEGLGFTGNGQGIAAHAVVLLEGL